ncbi:MAG: signal recognition particle-docking protein FtsY [Desulfobulbaceae bacterium]|nr:signal recognition particle-docking protein FtsY [Desulfobulbaceae bacterium]
MLGWFKKKLNKISEEKITPTAQPPRAEPAPPAQTVPPQETAGVEPPQNASLLQRLKERLAKSRESFIERVDNLFLGKKVIDDDLLDELEEILITADLGATTTQNLINTARARVKRQELSDPQALKNVIKEQILGYILNSERPAELVMPPEGPFVIMVVGVNGVGKTTTIGKMAHKFARSGQRVLLVAADTFRAAAVEQLQIWGKRIGVEVIAQQTGADPSSVVYDALDSARAKKYDVIIVDTAGRLHTKVNLMEELKKIKRVMDKKVPGAPHEVLLVIDATTGQNGISQARLFNETVAVTGLALTKLDGTAKGGIVVNICHEFNIPIRFIGIGEQMEDLRDFDANEFVEAFFSAGE